MSSRIVLRGALTDHVYARSESLGVIKQRIADEHLIAYEIWAERTTEDGETQGTRLVLVNPYAGN
jgi:hypothetical protein